MKVTLLPSSATGGTAPDQLQFSSSSVINDVLAIDAGCLGFYGTTQEQATVRHVFLTHSHVDHLGSLPAFLENVYEAGCPDCVTVYGSSAVLECLKHDVFNNRLWPDFLALSKGKDRFLSLQPFEPGQTRTLEGLQITAVAIHHVVPTVAYVVSDDRTTVAFISDTGPTDEIWQRLNALARVDAVFLECCFPNEMSWLAEVAKHLTPNLLAAEVHKLTKPTRFIVIHVKARYRDQIVTQLQALQVPGLEVGTFGMPYLF